ncbi:dihydrodipicolinate reductase [Arcticibacter tournemirensis]|uniref:4-hydroxy-tetrahydrodipicolinate reductase n=1 Tax=Arcticibacter tournemirensis TaxID=699437 RepID=A0A4V1KHI1_9SPHI|nr:4-hydroxy-tetrahydrodipicolinate reductase [Arcticibacter tournemirensis]KAA8475869.1 4-hydroxy-tetrahydrodipicolinate reductase [Arcticibacter tournemirensis]RXF67272.1 4-hydroxy-tetrahydrodipicolinate reductase [Arcticibacter tournemirensis]TQM52459.1 dihydrodipicolinate reductase [Arcticibacter tournemirensis]
MKIALLGYGKMGRTIERFALGRGHEIVLAIDENNLDQLTEENLARADVAIDFSTPDSVLSNISDCFSARVPIVVGTTGWYGHLQEVKDTCIESNNSLLYGSNFSIGVNLFFFVNKVFAKIMNAYPQYEVQVEEIHHTQKLDSPSGTAITIAEGIIEGVDRKKEWVNNLVGAGEEIVNKPDQLLIESHRIEDVPGTHTVIYSSEVDEIEFKHTAHTRAGFALGAVVAAEWLQGKKGFYSVADIFDFDI